MSWCFCLSFSEDAPLLFLLSVSCWEGFRDMALDKMQQSAAQAGSRSNANDENYQQVEQPKRNGWRKRCKMSAISFLCVHPAFYEFIGVLKFWGSQETRVSRTCWCRVNIGRHELCILGGLYSSAVLLVFWGSHSLSVNEDWLICISLQYIAMRVVFPLKS